MITREDIFSAVEEMVGASYDQPFEGDFDSYVFRHSASKKWFALLMKAPKKYFYGEGVEGYTDCLNVKCDPVLRDLLADNYDGIYPAWHMNKKLWATIPLESGFPKEELIKLLYHSFDLTNGKRK